MNYSLAANPASTKWLKGFVGGLQANSAMVSLCGHCYEQAWPKGSLHPGKAEFLWDGCPNQLVRFTNLPGLRFRSMATGYTERAKMLFQSNDFDAVVTYNPYSWHVSAARNIRAMFKVPWICLNLDFDDVGDDWTEFRKQAGDADGHLFLSHWGYEQAPVTKKIHLDSGVLSIPKDFGVTGTSDPFTIVYLGKLGKSGGLEVLLKLPDLIDHRNVRFVIGGKGYPEAEQKLKALADRDSRVEYLGFVDEHDVVALFERAAIFLNPRDPEAVVNDMVFPSKIMQYLQYGKTVVSTWTKGLDPVYRDLMVISEGSSAEDFAKAVNVAMQESPAERERRAERIRYFIEDSRLWAKQGARFVEFSSMVIRDFSMKYSGND